MTTRVCVPLLSLALLAAASASLAHAAQPAEVSVAGRIRPPAPVCTVQMPQEVQYGVIALDRINAGSITLLDEKGFSLAVSCDQLAKFTVQFVDTQPGTAVTDAAFLADAAQSLPGIDAEQAFGLGVDSSGQKIGAMFLKIRSAHYKPFSGWSPAEPFYQKGEDWVRDESGRVRDQIRYTFAATGYPAPIAATAADVNVRLVPVLDSGRLDLTQGIDAGGKLTVEISQI